MKDKKWNRTGMRMINFESEHRTFNKYIVSVLHGNVIGGGQYSSFIRPYSELECNGRINEPGHLRAFDLKHFNLTYRLKEWLEANKDQYIILYEFYHWKNGKRTLHGHVIQDVKDPSVFKTFKNPYVTWKSQTVLVEAINFLN
jgi:hypothetical protein